MEPKLKELYEIIRKFQNYQRASEMSPREREIIDWICDTAEKRSIYLNRDCTDEDSLSD